MLRSVLLSLVVTTAGAGSALAQSSVSTDLLETNRPPQPQLKPPAAQAPRVEPVVQAEGEGAALIGVRIKGSSLPRERLQAIWAPLRGQPLNPALAKKIASDLSALYKDTDIVLYGVSAPPQNLKDGILDLAVVEAGIARVEIAGDNRGKHVEKLEQLAAPLTQQKPLRRPLFERRVSLTRELPGAEVTPQFARAPGGPDQVLMLLSTEYQPMETALSINTRGTPALGRVQLKGEVSFNGLLLGGDRASISSTMSSDFERYRHFGASYSTPIGNDGVRAYLSAGTLKTKPDSIASEGEATTASVLVNYPLHLSFKKRIDISAGFDWLNSENALLGVNVDSSRTRALRFNISRAAAGGKTSTNARAALSFGLDTLGARAHPLLAQTDFVKLALTGAVQHKLSKQWSAKLTAAGQLTDDLLPSSEFFSIGGDVFGRAFVNGVASGDRGVGMSGELSWRSGRTKLYGFADHAVAWRQARAAMPDERFALASFGGGVRYRFEEKSVVGLELARALDAPTASAEDDTRFVVSLQMAR